MLRNEEGTRRTSVDVSAVSLLTRLLALLLRPVRVACASLGLRRSFLRGRTLSLAGRLSSLILGFDAFGRGRRGGF